MGAVGVWELPVTIIQAVVAVGVVWTGGAFALALVLGRALRSAEARYRSCARPDGAWPDGTRPSPAADAPADGRGREDAAPRTGWRRAGRSVTPAAGLATGTHLV